MNDWRTRIGREGGVWVGTYRRMTPTGALIEEYTSQKEARGVDGIWHERVTYTWPDGREKTLDFEARLAPDGRHIYEEDCRVRGETMLTGKGHVIFPHVWQDLPDASVLEVHNYISENRRIRLWQRVENGRLTEITVIQEDRLPDEPLEE